MKTQTASLVYSLLWLSVAATLWTCVTEGRRLRSYGGKIIGGRDASPGEFPYQVSLQRKYYFGDGSQHICGGSIVDEHHILTAGHCVYGQFQSQLVVAAGVLNVSDASDPTRVNLSVAQLYLHEQYDDDYLINDIALVRVERGFPLDSPVISAIPLRADNLSTPAVCTASGWGNTRQFPQKYPDILQALDVPLIPQDVCVDSYADYLDGHIEPGMICAGYLQGGRDACDGDSGGPLQCGGQLTGVVSWGEDCAQPHYPGVYTQVAHYKDWVERILARSYEDGALLSHAFR